MAQNICAWNAFTFVDLKGQKFSQGRQSSICDDKICCLKISFDPFRRNITYNLMLSKHKHIGDSVF